MLYIFLKKVISLADHRFQCVVLLIVLKPDYVRFETVLYQLGSTATDFTSILTLKHVLPVLNRMS